MARTKEAVNEQTGEIVEVETVDLDKSIKQADAIALAAANMKKTDFEESIDAFWKPQDVTRKDPKELQGAYLGYQLKGKLRMHAVRVPHPTRKGQMLTKRFTGTAQLNDKLSEAPGGLIKGDNGALASSTPPVRIEYLSEGKTQDGNRMWNFNVQWGAAKQ